MSRLPIGPNGRKALEWIAENPGHNYAEAQRGSGASYESVRRLLLRRLIREEPRRGGSYSLYITEAGRNAVSE